MGLGLNRNKKFRQGYYRLRNESKYISKDIPIYRSGIELKFFQFLDNNPSVIKWSSESVIIPYYDQVQGKWRKYYSDAYVEIMESDVLKRYIIEIKDLKETKKPKDSKKKKKETLLYESLKWSNNQDKWKSADEFARSKNCEFMLIGYSKTNGFEHVRLNF